MLKKPQLFWSNCDMYTTTCEMYTRSCERRYGGGVIYFSEGGVFFWQNKLMDIKNRTEISE